MMFLFNSTDKSVTFQKYANYLKVTLESRDGMRLQGDTLELNYYRLLKPMGLNLVTDEYFFSQTKRRVLAGELKKIEEVVKEVEVKEKKIEEIVKEVEVKEKKIEEVVKEVEEGKIEEGKIEEVGKTDKIYTETELDELTRDECRDILDSRGVEHDGIRKVAELREKVLETNPIA